MEVTLSTIKCPACGAILKADDDRSVIYCEYCETRIALKSESDINIERERKRKERELALKRENELEAERRIKAEREMEYARKKEEINTFTKNWLIVGTVLAVLGLLGLLPLLILGILAFVYCFNKRKIMLAEISGKIKLPQISNYTEKDYREVMNALESAGFSNIKCRQINVLRQDAVEVSYKIQSVIIDGKKKSINGEYCFPNAVIEILYNAVIRLPSVLNSREKDYGEILIALERAGFTNIRCEPLNDLMLGIMKKPGRIESIEINGTEVFSEDEGLLKANKWYLPDSNIKIYYHSLNR